MERPADAPRGAGPVPRNLGSLVSVAGVLMVLLRAIPSLRQGDAQPLWWNGLGLAVSILVMLLAAFGQVLPGSVLRVLWAVFCGGIALLAITCFLPADADVPVPPAPWPWPWLLTPVATAYTTLFLSPRWAIAASVTIGVLPGVSAYVFLGEIPPLIAWGLPINVANVGFTFLMLAVRSRLHRVREAERRFRDAEERRMRSAAEAAQRQRLAALVHDQVLSVLSAAMISRGAVSPELRAEAATALELLDSLGDRGTAPAGAATPSAAPSLSTQEARTRLVASWKAVAPGARIEIRAEAGSLPSRVVASIQDAACEALRNSIRHAGDGVTITAAASLADGRIDVRLSDDGGGFDPGAVAPERLGVRGSILDRLRQVDGAALIRSAPGCGTEVTLRWPS